MQVVNARVLGSKDGRQSRAIPTYAVALKFDKLDSHSADLYQQDQRDLSTRVT